MPRLPIDYSKGIIYKLCCKDPEITDVYVGSTTQFDKRKCQHKTECHNEKRRHYHLNIYQFIRNHGGWNNWEMVEIEKYQATDKLDLLKRERHWLEQLEATLNKEVPSRTPAEYQKQYYQKHKQVILQNLRQYLKQYRQTNKERIAEYKKEKMTCECGSRFRKDDKARHYRTKKHQQYIASIE
jgi:hypothetical protein